MQHPGTNLDQGLGTIVGSTIIGNLLNSSFVQAERDYKERCGLPDTFSIGKKSLPDDFPIEHARLRHIRWVVALFITATSLYGLSVQYQSLTSRPGWIVVPLSLQFLIAATSNAVFAVNQTLVSDLCPGKGASSTAVNNLIRCSFGAIGVAFIDQLIAVIGVGMAFVGLALIALIVTPLVAVQWYWGSTWRESRNNRSSKV